jgi:hypothetical protein
VVSHLFDEFSVHLVAAIPNGTWTEHMPWVESINRDPPQPQNGSMRVPQVPASVMNWTGGDEETAPLVL